MEDKRNLKDLLKPKTLLLIGGVFGFAALVAWFTMTYRIVTEPDPQALDGAFGAVTLFDDSAAARKLAAVIVSSTSSTSPLPLAPDEFTTVYAVPGMHGGLALHTLTTQSATGKCDRCRARLLPRDVVADGFVRSPLDGTSTPFEARVEGDLVTIRLGKGFRGAPPTTDDPVRPYRGLVAVPDQASIYYADRDFRQTSDALAAIPGYAHTVSSPELTDLMRSLGRRFELIYGSNPGDLLQPFLIHAGPSASNASSTSVIEASIKTLVGTFAPHRDTLTLPDQSLSYERRASTGDVTIRSKDIPWGSVKEFADPSGRLIITVFEDKNGEIWISDHVELLQRVILANPQSSIPMRADCIPTQANAGVILYPPEIPPYLKAFRLISILLNDRETELLTICGYLK